MKEESHEENSAESEGEEEQKVESEVEVEEISEVQRAILNKLGYKDAQD